MTPTATETWKGMTRGRGASQGDTAARVFDVVGATDGDQALALVTGTFGVDINQPYSADPNELKLCETMIPRFESPIYCQVIASYRVPPAGGFLATTNPFNLPWEYTWSPVVEDEPCDRDFFNNPILNANGDPPSTPARRKVIKRNLTIKRFEAFYDMATYGQYENSTNSDSIELTQPNGANVVFPPGTIFVTTIKPGVPYTTVDAYLPMLVDLETYLPANTGLTQPFQLHLLNQGSRGYYASGKKGAFLDANGEQVNADVPLNGNGTPIDTGIQVAGTGGTASTPIAAASMPTGATVENVASGTPYAVTFLRFQQYNVMPLLPLLTQTAQ